MLQNPITKEYIKEEEFADMLGDFCNDMSLDTDKVAKKVITQHRTIQQNIFGLFLSCCKQWAENYKTGVYDLRNEYTCQKAVEIIKLTDGMRPPYI